MHSYLMRGPDDNSPTYLEITTDDAGLIASVKPPFFRSSDAIIQALLRQWNEYASVGDPPPATSIDLFKQYLSETQDGLYRVEQVGVPPPEPEELPPPPPDEPTVPPGD